MRHLPAVNPPAALLQRISRHLTWNPPVPSGGSACTRMPSTTRSRARGLTTPPGGGIRRRPLEDRVDTAVRKVPHQAARAVPPDISRHALRKNTPCTRPETSTRQRITRTRDARIARGCPVPTGLCRQGRLAAGGSALPSCHACRRLRANRSQPGMTTERNNTLDVPTTPSADYFL